MECANGGCMLAGRRHGDAWEIRGKAWDTSTISLGKAWDEPTMRLERGSEKCQMTEWVNMWLRGCKAGVNTCKLIARLWERVNLCIVK